MSVRRPWTRWRTGTPTHRNAYEWDIAIWQFNRDGGAHWYFRRAAIAVVAACVLSTGCRSYMPYAGRPLESTAAARKLIYEVLEQQPGGAVLQIEVTDEKFRVAKSRGSGFLGMRSGQTAIYNAHMGDIRLSEKRGVFAVTILAPNGQPLLHVYSMEQTSAERLIDALETMRRASTIASQVDGR